MGWRDLLKDPDELPGLGSPKLQLSGWRSVLKDPDEEDSGFGDEWVRKGPVLVHRLTGETKPVPIEGGLLSADAAPKPIGEAVRDTIGTGLRKWAIGGPKEMAGFGMAVAGVTSPPVVVARALSPEFRESYDRRKEEFQSEGAQSRQEFREAQSELAQRAPRGLKTAAAVQSAINETVTDILGPEELLPGGAYIKGAKALVRSARGVPKGVRAVEAAEAAARAAISKGALPPGVGRGGEPTGMPSSVTLPPGFKKYGDPAGAPIRTGDLPPDAWQRQSRVPAPPEPPTVEEVVQSAMAESAKGRPTGKVRLGPAEPMQSNTPGVNRVRHRIFRDDLEVGETVTDLYGSSADVAWVGGRESEGRAFALSNKLGPGAMRDLASQFKQAHPEVTHLTGIRIGRDMARLQRVGEDSASFHRSLDKLARPASVRRVAEASSVPPRPRIAADVMVKYQEERAAMLAEFDAQAQAALASGTVSPEDLLNLRKQKIRDLDTQWHARLAEASKVVDEPSVHGMADFTQDAATVEVKAPPPRMDQSTLAAVNSPSPASAGGAGGAPPSPPAPSGPISSPANTVIANDPSPPATFREKIMAAWDKWLDQMSAHDEAGARMLGRMGFGAQAKTLLLQIGRARGAGRIARLPLFRGVYLYDKATGDTKRVADSLDSILGGLDGKAAEDLGNGMAATHHLELLGRRDSARSLDAADLDAWVTEGENLRKSVMGARADMRSQVAESRAAIAERLRLTRAQAKAGGIGETRALTAYRAAKKGRTGEANADIASAMSALGRMSRAEELQDILPTHGEALDEILGISKRVGGSERARVTQRSPRPKARKDSKLNIDERGTAIANEVMDDLAARYGIQMDEAGAPIIDPITNRPRINVIDDTADKLREWSRLAVIEQLDSIGYFKPAVLDEAGNVVTRGDKEVLLEANQRYAGFFRTMEEVEKLGDDGGGFLPSGVSASRPLHRISGGLSPDHKIVPVLESFVSQVQRVTMFVERQRVRNLLSEFADEMPDTIGKEIARFKGDPARARGFTVYRDGVRYTYTAPDDVMKAVESLSPNQLPFVLQAANLMTRFLRASATLVPNFSVGNAFRDFFTAGVYGSEFKYNPLTGFISGVAAQIPGGGKLRAWAEHWEAAGGALSGLVTASRHEAQATLSQIGRRTLGARTFAQWNEAKGMGQKLLAAGDLFLRPYENVASVIEQAPRIGAFRKAKLSGASDIEAAYFSRNINIDFGRGGSFGKGWNAVEAFVNANLQDVARFSTALRDRPVSTSIQALAYITLPSLAAWAAHKDDPDYQARSEWERDTYLHLKKREDGSWWMIPRPIGLIGLVYGHGIQKLFEAATDQGLGESVSEFIETVFEETPLKYSPARWDSEEGWKGSFEAIPSALQPAVEAAAGEQGFSSYRQGPIVPTSLTEGALPEERAIDSTSALARTLGKGVGAAPMKMDYLIQQYGGGMASQSLRLAEKGLQGVGAIRGGLPPLPLTAHDVPGLGKLVSTTPVGFASQPAQDFYRLEETAREAAGSLKTALENNRIGDYQRILREHPELVLANGKNDAGINLGDTRRTLLEIRNQMKVVRSMPGLTPEVRQDQLLKLNQMVIAIVSGEMRRSADYLSGMREQQRKQREKKKSTRGPRP